MKFEAKHIVGVRDIGVNNQMTNAAILSILEEVASTHSSTCGYGVNDINIKKKVWFLMDWKLKVLDRPKYEDEILVKTWARPIDKHVFYTYRDFEIFLNGKLVVICSSKWVLFDLNTNKIMRIPENILELYKPERESVFNEDEILKLKEPEEKSFYLDYEVRRRDIDVNKHMHNLNYLKLAYEVLPEEIYEKEELNNVRIMYKHQIRLGDKVKSCYSNINGKHNISIKSADEKILYAIVEIE